MGTAVLIAAFVTAPIARGAWQTLPPLPAGHGVASPFAGVSHNVLLVAGGANFPDKPPWQGGQKVWHDTVYALDRPQGMWRPVGKLPRPLAYGVGVTHRDSVVCVGGSDAQRHYAESFRLQWQGGQLVTTSLPSLPKPVANGCGAIVGDTLYIAGGQESADATIPAVFALDLAAPIPAWRVIETWPGPPRMLALAASCDGAFFVASGVNLVRGQRHYLRDAYRFDPGRGWRRIADLPHAVAAAPSPAPTTDAGFLVLGGDDGSQVARSADQHPGFSKRVWQYDVKANTWSEAGQLPAPRVTVPVVLWGSAWVIPSGEVRPGVRSPEVWSLRR